MRRDFIINVAALAFSAVVLWSVYAFFSEEALAVVGWIQARLPG